MGIMFDFSHTFVLLAEESTSDEYVAFCWTDMNITVTFLS